MDDNPEQQVNASPIAGFGVDIVEVQRMERVLERSPRFVTRVFTPGEREYCERRQKPAVHYATHFAAKEAVLKALGTGFSGGIAPADVEVTHNEKGRPMPLLHGRAAQVAAELGIAEIHLSLSRTHDTAVANALATTEETKPVREAKRDPKGELAATFKELRGMLDDMESRTDAAEGDGAPAAEGGAGSDG